MSVGQAVAKIVNFVRVGYPKDVPATDTFAVLAVLPSARREAVKGTGTAR